MTSTKDDQLPNVAGTGPNDANTFQDARGADRLDSLASPERQ
jgi:hypothetical protein